MLSFSKFLTERQRKYYRAWGFYDPKGKFIDGVKSTAGSHDELLFRMKFHGTLLDNMRNALESGYIHYALEEAHGEEIANYVFVRNSTILHNLSKILEKEHHKIRLGIFGSQYDRPPAGDYDNKEEAIETLRAAM